MHIAPKNRNILGHRLNLVSNWMSVMEIEWEGDSRSIFYIMDTEGKKNTIKSELQEGPSSDRVFSSSQVWVQ